MKIIVICITVFVISVLSNVTAHAQAPLSLLEVKGVSENLSHRDNKFSIADQVYENGLYCGGWDQKDKFSVYDVGGRFTRLQGWIGIPDTDTGLRERNYQINLDGVAAVFGQLSSGDKPVRVDLDITGVHSVRVILGFRVHLGDPVLLKEASQTSGVTTLVAPQDAVRLTTSSVSLLWEPVNGAIGYGVEVVCTKGNAPRIYALNAIDSTAKFDMSGIANGEYHWSVIAFNSKGVMGKFSKDRTFVVAR